MAPLMAPKTVTPQAHTLTPTPPGMVQGHRVLAIGRRLQVLVLDEVLALAPSTLCDNTVHKIMLALVLDLR